MLIVVRGPTYREDLAALNAYIRDVRPLIIAVDGGADAVLKAGLKPDVILGDMDSATDGALRCGAELIVHAYPDGRAPGRERLEDGGLDHLVIPAPGTSQDVAMLLAHEKGAELIVMVGAHFNLIEFLDKNRAGMSSTFLTRLRVGETLVDAKGVSRLYRPGIGGARRRRCSRSPSCCLSSSVVIASPGTRQRLRAALDQDQGRLRWLSPTGPRADARARFACESWRAWAIAVATTPPRWRPSSSRSRSGS